MNNLKTKIRLVIAVFMLSVFGVNAQLTPLKNNTVKNSELKNKQFKDLKLITGGNQGYVYFKTKSNKIKKIPNAEIIFKSEDGTSTQKIKTDSYGNYKIKLKSARYVVTIKHKGYTSYSTAPGFSVINKNFGTFNIPLKKLLKYPLGKKPNNIIAVFNTKTKKLIDVI